MRRLGKASNIIEEICEYSNIYQSLHVVMRGRKRKKSRVGRWIMAHEDEVIKKLQEQIRAGEFKISGYREMLVTDGPKVRTVQSIPMVERIGCNAIMAVVEEKIFRRYIRTTAASIKRRGMHDLLNYIRRDLEEHPEEMRYAYKFDIRKFYESIDQDFMMYALRRMFKDRVLLTMLERFVKMMPKGLSIGLRSSQGFGNMLLSMFLDHYLKDEKGYKHFYRYCDDGDTHFSTKKKAWEARNEIHIRAALMKLEVKGNERVFPVTEGIDFLGYVIYPTHTRLRKRNKQNAARRLHKVKSKKRRQEIIASLYGQCKHADCHNLFYCLTGIKMNDFKSMGIKPKFEDGKKRFKGINVSVRELVNIPIEVIDFETGIVPHFEREEYEKKVAEAKAVYNAALAANGGKVPAGVINPDDIEKPHGRYVVRIKVDGVEKKFFTASKEMWSILEQVREMDKFPFTTTIKAEMYGKKGETKYFLLDMRKVTGNMGVQPVECVNPKKNKWCVRFNIQNSEDGGTAEYDEEEFQHKPTPEDIEKALFDNGTDVSENELVKIGYMLGFGEDFGKRLDECRNARVLADPYLQLMEVVREQHLSTTNITDAVALRVPDTFHSFVELCKRGAEVEAGVIFRHEGKLWRVVQKHTPVGIHQPAMETASLYARVEPGHAGTKVDPIPYEQGMVFEKGKYYSQYGTVYVCILTTQTGYPYDLKDLPTIVKPA